MKKFLLLLSPRLWSLLNRFRRGEEGSGLRLLALGLVATGFWAGVFYASFRVLGYFREAEGFGDILSHKLMGMIWLTFFAILVFSNVITALSTFFLSKDLTLVHAAPVSMEHIFWARFVDTLVDSSWMVLFFGFPVFLAFGLVFDAGLSYYLRLVTVTIPFLALASACGLIFIFLVVNIFPAHRTRDILLLLTILVVIILYLMFRFMRPERLVNPDAFSSALNYFASFSTPSSPYLPSQWALESLWPSLKPGGYSQAGFHLLLLWSTASAFLVIASFISGRVYGAGFSKAQEGARRVIKKGPVDLLVWLAQRPFSQASRVLIAKDIKFFFRDNTQWSQLLLLLALIVIYLYNFSVLDLRRSPIGTFYLQNIISFLNIALASFVVASLSVRFVFPAVSAEGFSYWIIRTSPLSLNRFLWTKFGFYAPPLVLVAEILIVLSNWILNVTPLMMLISTVTIFFIVIGLTGLGVGLGAVYPRFETENLAQVATGFGGMVYMVISALFVGGVVVLEAWPVYTLFMAQAKGLTVPMWKWVLMALCGLGILSANIAAVAVPMTMGRRKLLARESI